ncbi:MAG TPA: hypothetical protein VHF26_07270 [Trebonia sp.]|nr:hypothetical protein [Trebonia sp.]
MDTTTFTALCERAGRWWSISVPQIDGLTVQVRSLDQAEIVTRQLISRTLALPAEGIRIEVIHEAPTQVSNAIQLRHAARHALETAVQATRDALDVLAQEGVAFLDAATMLGLSPAEIEQYGSVITGEVVDPAAPSSRLQMAGQ